MFIYTKARFSGMFVNSEIASSEKNYGVKASSHIEQLTRTVYRPSTPKMELNDSEK